MSREKRIEFVDNWIGSNRFQHDSDSRMLWVDVETSGLDPMQDEILEVGFMMTDELGNYIDHVEVLMIQRIVDYQRLRDTCSEVVRNMHDKSGLWEDIQNSTATDTFVNDSHIELRKFLNENVKGKLPLAGSSVHFDRRWLELWLPYVSNYITHRNIDASTLREIASMISPQLVSNVNKLPTLGAHRAIPDIIDSIELYRNYMREFGSLSRAFSLSEIESRGSSLTRTIEELLKGE